MDRPPLFWTDIVKIFKANPTGLAYMLHLLHCETRDDALALAHTDIREMRELNPINTKGLQGATEAVQHLIDAFNKLTDHEFAWIKRQMLRDIRSQLDRYEV